MLVYSNVMLSSFALPRLAPAPVVPPRIIPSENIVGEINSEGVINDHAPASQANNPVEVNGVVSDLVDFTQETTFTLPLKPVKECCRYGCKTRGADLHPCVGPNCTRVIHYMCYQYNCRKYAIDMLPDMKVACKKRCHEAYCRREKKRQSTKDSNAKLPWDEDGKCGRDDPKCSLSVLLDWWRMEGNYSKYRGDGNKGVKKREVAQKLADEINKVVVAERSVDAILGKIQAIEKSWKCAHDWACETGQGVKETDPEGFKGACLLRCPYYFMLYEIMEDRSANRALATTSDLYDPPHYKNDDGGISVSSFESNGSEDFVKVTPPENKRKSVSIRGKNKKQKTLDKLESETLHMLNSSKSVEEAKLEETKRHNLVMEQSMAYQVKSMEMEFKMQAFKNYNIMKKDGWSDTRICKVFPDMHVFCLDN